MSACFKIVISPSFKVVSAQDAPTNLPPPPARRCHSEIAFDGDLSEPGRVVSAKAVRRGSLATHR